MYSPENKFTEADKLLSNARVLIQQNETAKAFTLLIQITRQHPQFGKAWFELGKIMIHELEDFEGAVECFKIAVDSSPDYTPAYLAYADVLFSTGQYAEMNAIINQVMDLKGVRTDLALQKSAMLLESQQRYDEAIEVYIKALMNSFDDDEITKIEKGINRCKIKKNYL